MIYAASMGSILCISMSMEDGINWHGVFGKLMQMVRDLLYINCILISMAL